jgi:hypothetical protein
MINEENKQTKNKCKELMNKIPKAFGALFRKCKEIAKKTISWPINKIINIFTKQKTN